MPQETVGYVELEWVCPNCNVRNAGARKTCSGCGAAQPADVAFQQAVQEDLVTDQAVLARAQAAPDIHCGYCGARNVADAKVCSQCGANLGEGKARSAGRVVGARQVGAVADVKCPFCGEPNPPAAQKCGKCGGELQKPVAEKLKAAPSGGGCSPRLLIILGVLALIVLVAVILLGTRTSESVGSVQSVGWTRSVAVLGLAPVTRETWRTQVPSGASVGTCTQKVAKVQDEPASNARKVCGTPYVVDKGTGFGQVVQDCQYEIYADWCQYSTTEWRVVDTVRLTGSDLNPRWPQAQLSANQRAGDRSETYRVTFMVNDKTLTYDVNSAADFASYRIGSRWLLAIDGFGTITSVQPAR